MWTHYFFNSDALKLSAHPRMHPNHLITICVSQNFLICLNVLIFVWVH